MAVENSRSTEERDDGAEGSEALSCLGSSPAPGFFCSVVRWDPCIHNVQIEEGAAHGE